jgi:hypothetical protein
MTRYEGPFPLSVEKLKMLYWDWVCWFRKKGKLLEINVGKLWLEESL